MDHYRVIANLEHRFLESLDQRDFPSVAALFVHGSLKITVPGMPEAFTGTGEAQVTSLLDAMIPPEPEGDFGRHIASNLIVEVDEKSWTASARLHTSLLYVSAGAPAHLMGLGRHLDELEFIDGQWWFRQKTIVGDVRYPRG